MYESPIEKIFGDIQEQINKQDEEQLMIAVTRSIGYEVNKDELLKALRYDRNQYEKGYADAKATYESKWVPVSERLPEDDEIVLGTNSSNDLFKTYAWDDCGTIKWYADGCFDVPVIAWMPLPERFEGSV